jgi:molecular chaperone Hsp33
MSAYIKGEERITLQVQMAEPRFALIVDVNADGSSRGRFTPSRIPRSRPLVGAIMVIKHDAERELYRGVAPVEDTDFQGALQAYLVRSQQSVGIVLIEASLGPGGAVEAARGLLVEKLPDQDTAVFHDLFGGLAEADLARVLEGAAAGELWGFPLQVLDTRELRFACTCSRERSLDILRGLGVEELRAVLSEQGQAELTCNFCMEVYAFDGDALRALISQLNSQEN